MPSVAELELALAEAKRREIEAGQRPGENLAAMPRTGQTAGGGYAYVLDESHNEVGLKPEAEADPYAPVEWGGAEYDFRTPSGQLCRLRRLPIEHLAKAGILDRMAHLPGVAAEMVTKAQGLPPEKQEMPDGEQVAIVSELVDLLLPIVVVAPKVYQIPPEGEARVAGRIYVDSIDFGDRVAILNRVIAPLKKLEAFRPQS